MACDGDDDLAAKVVEELREIRRDYASDCCQAWEFQVKPATP
jgi:hypothetical protein